MNLEEYKRIIKGMVEQINNTEMLKKIFTITDILHKKYLKDNESS